MHYFALLALIATLLMTQGTPGVSKEVTLTPVQASRLRIEVRKVEAADAEVVALLPATIVPPSNARFAVSAPFAGNVQQVLVITGQAVTQGQELVRLASRDILDVIAKLEQARVELKSAEVVARRMRILHQEKAIALRQVEEAEALHEKARSVLEQVTRASQIGGITLGSDGTYSLHAPRAGRVVEVRASTGAMLDALATAVVIDSLDELWVHAQVPARLVSGIKAGDAIETDQGVHGTVIAVGMALDPVFRSAPMLARIPTDAGHLPGQAISVTVLRTAQSGALRVPVQAVVWQDGEASVFVRTDTGFTTRPVTILGSATSHDGSIVVRGEIAEGEEVAVSGLAQLEKLAARDE